MDQFGNTEFHGWILSTKVKVEAKWWSDFVFDSEYQLRSIGEVERFINQYGHLPDMPSEEEVLEEGIDVAEMQAMQQQKIEELTLYIIQQQKMIEELQNVVKTIQNK